jgi:hypothetical protein
VNRVGQALYNFLNSIEFSKQLLGTSKKKKKTLLKRRPTLSLIYFAYLTLLYIKVCYIS